jgi:hypothetical protein
MNMKIILFVITILFVNTLKINAQSAAEVGNISLSIVLPENSDELNSNLLSKLRTKLIKIVSSNGLSGSGYNSNFIMYPVFDIYNEELVEGMQNIVVVGVELSLFIKQVDNNMVFSSYTLQIESSGNDRNEALLDAINQIPVSNENVKKFLSESKQKILSYYEKECANISKQAETASNMSDYEKAFGILMSVPKEVSCSSQLSQLSVKIYKAYQNKICSENTLKGKAEISAGNYNEALYILSNVDPSSSCFGESKSLIASIESKVSAEKKKEWDFQLKQYSDEVELEKQRIGAIKDIAVAYYQRTQPTYNYNLLIVR